MAISNDSLDAATDASARLAHVARAADSAQADRTGAHRRELLSLLMQKKVPEKTEIIRVKELVRELARNGGDDERQIVPEEFISAYLDLYLGRMTGDASIEKAGLRRCVDCLGASRRSALDNAGGRGR